VLLGPRRSRPRHDRRLRSEARRPPLARLCSGGAKAVARHRAASGRLPPCARPSPGDLGGSPLRGHVGPRRAWQRALRAPRRRRRHHRLRGQERRPYVVRGWRNQVGLAEHHASGRSSARHHRERHRRAQPPPAPPRPPRGHPVPEHCRRAQRRAVRAARPDLFPPASNEHGHRRGRRRRGRPQARRPHRGPRPARASRRLPARCTRGREGLATTSFSASSATSSVRSRPCAAPAADPGASVESSREPQRTRAPLRPPLPRFRGRRRLAAQPSRQTRFPMATRHDPELEQFKRTIDLVEYAKKSGYEPRPNDGAHGLTVLDHPNRDRIVVARSPDGPWIYASVTDYEPRAPGEPAADALSRLRYSIDRAKDKGSIVEFVQQRDWTARRGEVPLEHARERLREFCSTGRPLDFEGALQPPPYASGRERSADPAKGGPRPGAEVAPGEVIAQRRNPELHQRRYDWSPY